MKKLIILVTLAVGAYLAYTKSDKVKSKTDDLLRIFKKGVKKGHELVENKEICTGSSTG